MNDTISRQGAIEALKNQMSDCNDLYNIPVRRSIVILEQLPPAQPDLDQWCTDCKEYDSEKHHCPRFSRVIREALKDAQLEQRKGGKWIPQDMNQSNGMISTAVYYYPKCSVCGWTANFTNFCPNCGADMRGEKDEVD